MPGTRERIVATSAELFARQGYAATGLKQIVADLTLDNTALKELATKNW